MKPTREQFPQKHAAANASSHPWKAAPMHRPRLREARVIALVILLGCLAPIFGWADTGVATAMAAAEAAKNKMIAACTAQNQPEVDHQLAIVLQILATNQMAKALLAEPSTKDLRSVLLSGYSGVQQNEKKRACFFKIMHALYGAEDAQRVLRAFEKMFESRGMSERKTAAEQIRKEFKATGRWLELKKTWQCLTTSFVFQKRMADGQLAWVWGSVRPETTELVFGKE